MTTTPTQAASLRGVTKTFGEGPTAVQAVRETDLTISPGELVVVLGQSGSGKTTLLNLVGGIEQPTSGELVVAGRRLGELDDRDLTEFRREHVGFVFQFFNLIPTLTARENVELVVELTGSKGADVDSVLAEVGLAERADHFPGTMSGGEQQRVAIARAVAKRPPLLLCDEPTGALDLETGRQVLGVLADLRASHDMTILMVTHNAVIGEMADRVLHMRSGEVVDDVLNPDPVAASRLEW